jgi:hypothetical protein
MSLPARIKKKGKQTLGLRTARPGGVSASSRTDDRGVGYLSRIEFACRQVNLAVANSDSVRNIENLPHVIRSVPLEIHDAVAPARG